MITAPMSLRLCLIGSMIAMLPLTAQKPAPTLTLARDLRIDATTNNLSTVNWIAAARNGTIIIGQPQDHLVRFFDPQGNALGTVGREGDGPEEFRGVDRAGWLADTLWVDAGSNNRVLLIAPNRNVLRNVLRPLNVRRSARDSSPSPSVFMTLGVYPQRSQLVLAMFPFSPTSPRAPWATTRLSTGAPGALLRVTPDGLLENIVAWFPVDVCGYMMTTVYALCGHPLMEVAPDGNRVAFAAMTSAGPASVTYHLGAVAVTGDTIFARSETFAATPIPASVLDSIAAVAARQPKRGVPAGREPKIDPPRVYAPLERLIIGRDGSVWIELRATTAGKPFRVLDANGKLIGTCVVPANVTIEATDREHVWGTEKDADDLESVVRYRVRGGS